MNKTFLDMQNNVAYEVQDTSTALKTIIKGYLNNRYFQVLRSLNWNCTEPDYSFDTVAGTQDYSLPDDFGKPICVHDDTNNAELAEKEWSVVCSEYPGDTDGSGTVERYSILELPVMAQPSSASVLACVSSSASDTAVTLLVRGISGGVEVNETVSLNGLTPVNTTNQYTRIKAISKNTASVGKVTLTSNSAAVTVAVMPPKMTTAYYKVMRLHYVPSSVITIKCPYIIRPQQMIEDYDYPVIDIADMIELGAKADTWRYKRQFQKGSVFEAQFTVALADHAWDKENKSNQITQFVPQMYSRDIY